MSQFIVTTHQLTKWAIALRHGMDAASYAPVTPFTGEDERVTMAHAMEEIKGVLRSRGEPVPAAIEEKRNEHEH